MRQQSSLRQVGLLTSTLLMLGTSPTDPQRFDIVTLASPNETAEGHFAASVSGAGDVNNDGFADVIVGAWGDPDTGPYLAGRAYVFSGQGGSPLFELTSPNEQIAGAFGWSVSGGGDVNRDGTPDTLVGAYTESPGTSPHNAGRAYAFSGQDGSPLLELVSPNQQRDGLFGYSVSDAGDVNRDRFTDVIVGAIYEFSGGRAYVFSGDGGGVLYEFVPPPGSSLFGYSVSDAGDLDQDGFADVIVGDPTYSSNLVGRAYVFGGRDGSLLFTLRSPNEVFRGFFGHTVSGAGDVNRDGVADVIVGASAEFNNAGRAYAFSGQDGGLLFEFVSPNQQLNGLFGYSVCGAGDINQDGFADVIVGAKGEELGSAPFFSGRAYVFSGQNGSVIHELRPTHKEVNGSFGNVVSGAGDVNRDGIPDVIVGAWNEDPGESPIDAGRAYIFALAVQRLEDRPNDGGPPL